MSSDVPANVQPARDAAVFVGARPLSNLSAGTLSHHRDVRWRGGVVARASLRRAGVGRHPCAYRHRRLVIGCRSWRRRRAMTLCGCSLLMPRLHRLRYDGQTLVIRLLLDVTSAQEVQVLSGEVVIIEVDNTGPAGWELGGEEDGDS